MRTNTIFKSILLLLILSLGLNSVFAENTLKPVKDFKVDLQGQKSGDIYIASGSIFWIYPSDEETASSFNIYIAEGKTDDFEDFQLFETVNRDDNQKARDNYLYQFKDLESSQNGWSFTIKSSDGEQESIVARYFYAEIKNTNSPKKLFIVSKPDTEAKIGVEYSYLPETETDVADPKYGYNLVFGPDGAEIDEETGEIKWTPEGAGIYKFALEIYVSSGNLDKIEAVAKIDWVVKVIECDEFATINGSIVDEEGNKINFGVVNIFQYKEINDQIQKTGFHTARIANGEFSIPYLDKGDYFILVEAFGDKNTTQFYPMWYDNALNFEDATALTIDCGDNVTIEFVMKEIPKPNLYIVSGTVIDSETDDPVRFATVEFRGIENNSTRMNHFTFKTNQNGYYEGKLPDTYTYTAVANGHYFTDQQNKPQAYFPQFFELADNPTDAKTITLTENVENIDFSLIRVPNYENSIYGNVINVDGEAISEAFVSVFLVDSDNQNYKYIYSGKNTITDEFGAFSIENLIPGQYVILARTKNRMISPGFYLEDDIATLSWQDATRVTVEETGASGSYEVVLPMMEKNDGKGRIRGKIARDKKGVVLGDDNKTSEGILGATVYLVNSNNNVVKSLDSDELGNFEIDRLAAGTYTLLLDKIGFNANRSEIVVNEDEIIDADFEMTPVIVSSVNDELAVNFDIYPNPTSSLVNVSLEEINIPIIITVYNITGNEFMRIERAASNQFETLNLENLSPGTYFIKVESGTKASVKSIVITR